MDAKKNKSEKILFINNLLEYSVKTHVDTKTKERLITLIGKEIENTGLDRTQIEAIIDEKWEKILKSIMSIAEPKPVVEENKNTKQYYFNHKPTETVEFLKKFKYDNASGFKELVHSPKFENFNIEKYDEIIQKAEDSFNSTKFFIPTGLYYNLKELIALMRYEGRQCFIETKEHPYLNVNSYQVLDEKYVNLSRNSTGKSITDLIQGFKRNYRFDSEKTEASILRDLIINISNLSNYSKNDFVYEYFTKSKIKKEKTTFIDIEFSTNFDNWAIFFTWVPSIKVALKEILEDILKHGNLNGETEYESNHKRVTFSVDREYDEIMGYTKIPLMIFDEGSICMKPIDDFYQKIMDKKETLKGICDWRIEADFTNGNSYSFNLLPKTPPQELNHKVGGFKHILTFYEI